MGCHRFTSGDGTIVGHICMANIYKYDGLLFEYHSYLGPTQVKKDYSQRKRISKGFWDTVSKFEKLTDEEREEYLISS